MTDKYERKDSKFEQIWGKQVLSSGFTMLPNVLLRSLPALGLSYTEAIVALEIYSVGEGFVSAKQITEWTGMCMNTVRNAFRRLHEMGYCRRIYVEGEANRFDCRGLISAVQDRAKNIQRDAHIQDRSLPDLIRNPTQDSDTNKEPRLKHFKEGPGYALFRSMGAGLKGRSKNINS